MASIVPHSSMSAAKCEKDRHPQDLQASGNCPCSRRGDRVIVSDRHGRAFIDRTVQGSKHSAAQGIRRTSRDDTRSRVLSCDTFEPQCGSAGRAQAAEGETILQGLGQKAAAVSRPGYPKEATRSLPSSPETIGTGMGRHRRSRP